MKLNDAISVYAGSAIVERVLIGRDLVWENDPIILDAIGQEIFEATKAEIKKLNPDGKSLVFGLITDIHRCHDGITYASNGLIDDHYSMNMMSKLSGTGLLDAIFCGGDIVNARAENKAYIIPCMQDVVEDFSKMKKPVYFTVGNHDKKYASDSVLNTNEFLRSLYGDRPNAVYVDDTNYYVDFQKQKIRMIVVNEYDAVVSGNSESANCTGNWTDALDVPNRDEWLVGVVYHGKSYSGIKDGLSKYLNDGGRGIIGSIGGHEHSYQYSAFNGYNNVLTTYAYALESQKGTADEYGLAVFAVNPDTGYIHQIKVGRGSETLKFWSEIPTMNDGILSNGRKYANGMNVLISAKKTVEMDVSKFAYVNLTDLSHFINGNISNLTNDTSKVIYHLDKGDALKINLKFHEETVATYGFKITTAQGITLASCKMGVDFVGEYVASESIDITAIGLHTNGSGTTGGKSIFDLVFELIKNEKAEIEANYNNGELNLTGFKDAPEWRAE